MISKRPSNTQQALCHLAQQGDYTESVSLLKRLFGKNVISRLLRHEYVLYCPENPKRVTLTNIAVERWNLPVEKALRF